MHATTKLEKAWNEGIHDAWNPNKLPDSMTTSNAVEYTYTGSNRALALLSEWAAAIPNQSRRMWCIAKDHSYPSSFMVTLVDNLNGIELRFEERAWEIDSLDLAAEECIAGIARRLKLAGLKECEEPVDIRTELEQVVDFLNTLPKREGSSV